MNVIVSTLSLAHITVNQGLTTKNIMKLLKAVLLLCAFTLAAVGADATGEVGTVLEKEIGGKQMLRGLKKLKSPGQACGNDKQCASGSCVVTRNVNGKGKRKACQEVLPVGGP
jgi:hypothetical protein